MNITALYNAYHTKSGEQQSNINQIVAASLLHIIGHYFTRWSSSFVITLSCNREKTCRFYNDIFEKLFAGWDEWPFQIVNVQKGQRRRLDGIRRNNMILVDSYESFLEADISSYTHQNDYNEYYFIFVQNRDSFLAGDMQNIFEYCWQHQLINCVIQIQNAKGEVLLYTYYPFMAQHCGKVEAVQINTYNGSSLVHEELFPKKLANLYGCPLRVALWNVPPYMFLSNDSSGELQITGGFEGRMLLELSHKLNFTLDIKVPADDAQRGVILANGTLTGALRMLNDRDVDLSMGSFSQNSKRSAVVTSTMNYYQSTMSMVTLASIFRLSSAEVLLHPFKLDTWIVLVVICALTVGVTSVHKHIYMNTMPKISSKGTMDVLLILLGMPSIYEPRKIAARILTVSWMFFGLVIRSIYNGFLFHMIRSHITSGSTQTLEAMMAERFSMIVSRHANEDLTDVTGLEGINMMVVDSASNVIAMDYLQELSLEEAKHTVAALPMDYIKYYMHVHGKQEVFQILPYDIMMFKLSIYLTKHSYLIDQLDELLVLIHGSGLLEYFAGRQLGTNYLKRPEDKPIGVSHLYVAFMTMIWCYVMATLVLVAELLYKKFQGGRFNKK